MVVSSVRWMAALVLLTLLVDGSTAVAQAAPAPPADPAPTSCLELHERAQEQRFDGDLLAARTTLRACVASQCPAMVAADCAGWLVDTERMVPTLVFDLQNPELQPDKLRFWVDGNERPVPVGEAVEFDPGALRVRVEVPGYEPFEETLVVREGERNRVVPIRLALPPPPPAPLFPPALLATPTRPQAPPPPREERAITPLLAYALAGVAVVATASSAAFAWSAFDQRAHAQKTCAPLCSRSVSRNIGQKFLVADLSAGVAVLTGGASITLFILDSRAEASAPAQPSSRRRHFEARVGGVF